MLYSFDTSCLINGRRDLLPPETFHTLWANIETMIDAGSFRCVDVVKDELSRRDDEVRAWACARPHLFVPLSLELQQETRAVLTEHQRMLGRGKGRNGADPFVVALARLHAGTVVTEETMANNLTSPRIPDVCEALGHPVDEPRQVRPSTAVAVLSLGGPAVRLRPRPRTTRLARSSRTGRPGARKAHTWGRPRVIVKAWFGRVTREGSSTAQSYGRCSECHPLRPLGILDVCHAEHADDDRGVQLGGSQRGGSRGDGRAGHGDAVRGRGGDVERRRRNGCNGRGGVRHRARRRLRRGARRAGVELGHNLGLTLVAEGVEDHLSAQRLIQTGCETAQGYHYARPIPEPMLADWLTAHHPAAATHAPPVAVDHIRRPACAT